MAAYEVMSGALQYTQDESKDDGSSGPLMRRANQYIMLLLFFKSGMIDSLDRWIKEEARSIKDEREKVRGSVQGGGVDVGLKDRGKVVRRVRGSLED